MDKADDRSVKLPAEYVEAIDDAVKAGEYGSVDDAVADAVRDWKERRENFGYTIEELRAEIQKGIDSGPAEPGEPFMEQLRQRYAAMAKGGFAAE